MLSTIASWAALLTLAAATTLYYNPDLIKKYLTQPAPQIPEEPKAAPKKRPKKTHTTRLDGDEHRHFYTHQLKRSTDFEEEKDRLTSYQPDSEGYNHSAERKHHCRQMRMVV